MKSDREECFEMLKFYLDKAIKNNESTFIINRNAFDGIGNSKQHISYFVNTHGISYEDNGAEFTFHID
jgi:hypothetical protein